MEENKHNLFIVLFAKPARAIFWHPISDFFFETISRNEFIYF